MAGLSLKHIYKVYPNGAKAVNDFNMQIADKEFIVFVGPSGCGKSTTLRMIAGLEDISAGELKIGDMVVNDVEPKDRDIAMVFQNYALYPHMTVYENIAFGLRLRKVPYTKQGKGGKQTAGYRKYTKEEVHEKVLEASKILGITEYLSKKPKEMSGGQRQRVSLGRAIVREPKVMLLDEPLSNLDAKLRTQMRAEISKLHAKLGTTFIYVTHDQTEAMTMGTRIVVMKSGFVQQIDTPKNLYNYPCNKFVAGFIGTPQMNFFEGYLKRTGEKVEISFDYCGAKITVPYSHFYKIHPEYLNGDKKVCIGIRAEDIAFGNKMGAVVKMVYSHKEDTGNEILYYGDLNMEGDGYLESSTRVIIKSNTDFEFTAGDVMEITLNPERMHIFDAQTEQTIVPRIPENNYLDCRIEGRTLCFCGQKIALPPAISCSEGDYELIIPSSAVYKGGDIEAEILSCEKVSGSILVSFKLSGRILFAVMREEVPLGKAMLGLDLKQLTLLKDGAKVVESMAQVMSFEGKILKEKVKREGKNCVKFVFGIENAKFDAPDRMFERLIASMGVKRAFSEELIFECSPYDIHVADAGISAEVIEIIDYGREKFALCRIGNKKVYVRSDGNISGAIHLKPDIQVMSVIQKQQAIRII